MKTEHKAYVLDLISGTTEHLRVPELDALVLSADGGVRESEPMNSMALAFAAAERNDNER